MNLIKILTTPSVYPLASDMANIKSQIQAQLTDFEIQEGVRLKGTVHSFKVTKVFLAQTGIMVDLAWRGKFGFLWMGWGDYAPINNMTLGVLPIYCILRFQ